MGCMPSRPIQLTAKLNSLAFRATLWLRALFRKFFSRLRTFRPSRPVKTSSTPSESGPHVPIEEPPVMRFLWEEQTDRYNRAMDEMSLSKGERLRKESTPEQNDI